MTKFKINPKLKIQNDDLDLEIGTYPAKCFAFYRTVPQNCFAILWGLVVLVVFGF